MAGAVATAALGLSTSALGATGMYGLIGKMLTTPGNRDAVIAALLESTTEMPGCLSYIVGTDPSNADAIWITEVWDSPGSHQASLGLPQVKAAIAKARPSAPSQLTRRMEKLARRGRDCRRF